MTQEPLEQNAEMQTAEYGAIPQQAVKRAWKKWGILGAIALLLLVALITGIYLATHPAIFHEGTYRALDQSAGVYMVLENDDGVSGMAYFHAQNLQSDIKGIWKIDEGIIALETRNGSTTETVCYLIDGDYLIPISTASLSHVTKFKKQIIMEMSYHTNAVPKGKTFNWEVGEYQFYKDGTALYSYTVEGQAASSQYDYYVKGNVIYLKEQSSDAVAYPAFYIYKDKYVFFAQTIMVKD